MPRNVSGIYGLPAGYAATANNLATAAQHNDPLEDLESDANAARPVSAGGTGSTTATGARTALGVAIGTDVQAYNANLASLSGLTLAANKGLYSTAADTVALFDLTAAGLALLDDADEVAQVATLGLNNALRLDERADHVNTPAAGKGEFWVRNDDPCVPVFTDDAGTDKVLASRAYVDGFTSTAQTITSSGQLTLAHGMARAPRIVSYRLVCSDVGGEAGYSENDQVIVDANNSGATTGRITTAKVDATNIVVRFANATSVFSITHATTGTPTALTNSKWDFYVEGRY